MGVRIWALGIAATGLAVLAIQVTRRHRNAFPDPVMLSLMAKMQAAVYQNPALAYPVPYRLFTPNATEAGVRYPLVVYLHGAGGRGNDNQKQLGLDVERILAPEARALGPFFLVAPQCPDGDEWINRHASPPFRTYDQSKFPESDASKATLTGVSMGGSGTWDLITRHPGVFAAAIPVTGVGDPSRASVIAKLPIWAFHGTRDNISPIENARTMRRALQALGSNARFSELEGVGHDSWNQAYTQLETFRWLFQQRRSAE
jgi:predicted peptidase